MCHYHFVIKECYMRFDDLKFSLGGICRLCRVVSPWSDRHPSYLYFFYTRVAELKVHLLLLHSSVLNRVELGYLVRLLNQMKCSDYKIYWNVFVNIEPLKCNEHHLRSVHSFPSDLCFAKVLIHFRSDKFQALDMPYFSKGHAMFFQY